MNALEDAHLRFIEQCMSERGYELTGSKRLEVPDEIGNPFDVRRRYGHISLEQATLFGYRYPFAKYEHDLREQMESEAATSPPAGYTEALSGKAGVPRDIESTGPGDLGCSQLASLAIFNDPTGQGLEGLPGYAELLRVQIDSFERSGVDPEVVDAERDWSDCMLERGFRYSASAGPLNQYAGAIDDVSPPSDEERSVAIADAECRDQVDLLEIRLRVETRHQNEALEGLQEQVQTLTEAIDESLRRAADL